MASNDVQLADALVRFGRKLVPPVGTLVEFIHKTFSRAEPDLRLLATRGRVVGTHLWSSIVVAVDVSSERARITPAMDIALTDGRAVIDYAGCIHRPYAVDARVFVAELIDTHEAPDWVDSRVNAVALLATNEYEILEIPEGSPSVEQWLELGEGKPNYDAAWITKNLLEFDAK